MNKKEPSGKILITLVVWGIICFLFPFPVNLIIMFIGGIIILTLAGIREYSIEEERKKSNDFVKEKKLPSVSETEIKTKPNPSKKHRPKVRVEFQNEGT